MAYGEFSVTDLGRKQYEMSRDNRLKETDLVQHVVYNAMASLKCNAMNVEACAFPFRVQKIEQTDPCRYAALLIIVDEDLVPVWEADAVFENGFWVNINDSVTLYDAMAKECHIQSYTSPIDDELDKFMTELSLPANIPILV